MVIVINTLFPLSPLFGVYVNANGDFVAEDGLTEPVPLVVIVTFDVLPPKVLPLTVTGVVPHVLPLVLAKVTVGGLTHCPHRSIEIIKKRLTKRVALVIFLMRNIDGKLQKYCVMRVIL